MTKVAAVQAAPVFLDREATVDLVCARIAEAGAAGAKLFNTLLFFDHLGDISGRHRKLVPTGGERLVWAPGDATGLRAYETPIGRVGGLICWENYMPLARYALYATGVQIYIATTWDHGEGWLA